MKTKVVDLNNKNVSEIDLPEVVFNIKVLPDLIYQYIRFQGAKKRQGSRKTKTRSEVKGKSKKPFAQKGTGNARQGSSKAPNFRGGAVSMGPQVRDHSFVLNKKEKKLALKCALSEKNNNEQIIILDNLKLEDHKTKLLVNKLNKFKFNSALILHNTKELDSNFKKASANIPNVNLLPESGINVKDLITHDKIFILKDLIKPISKRLS